jgi:hypothetical protein
VSSPIDFKISGISFLFNGLLRCTESLSRPGKRLHQKREHLLSPAYEPERPCSVKVASPMPSLSVSLTSFPTELLAGEMVDATFDLSNAGQVGSITDLRVLCSHPHFFAFVPPGGLSPSLSYTLTIPNTFVPNTPSSIPLDSLAADDTLPPGRSISVPITCRGDSIGRHIVSWLFVFSAKVSVCVCGIPDSRWPEVASSRRPIPPTELTSIFSIPLAFS